MKICCSVGKAQPTSCARAYVYAFVRPGTGESEYWLLPSVSTEAFNLVLFSFVRMRGAGEGKLVLLVPDRAGWHTSKQVGVPEGVGLCFLPPYSPELLAHA